MAPQEMRRPSLGVDLSRSDTSKTIQCHRCALRATPRPKRPYLALLPQELLDTIATFAVVQAAAIVIQSKRPTKSGATSRWTGPKELLNLAKVSRRMYATVIPIFYKANAFTIRTRHLDHPVGDFFRTRNIGRATAITLSTRVPLGIDWQELAFLENLRLLKLYCPDYDNRGNWQGALADVQRLCPKLTKLRHLEFTVQSPTFTSLGQFSFRCQAWNAIEEMVDGIRDVMRKQNPEACVHLREILLHERQIEGVLFDSSIFRKRIRLYAAPGVYVFVKEYAEKRPRRFFW